ncbi:redoxin family protein [Rubripirellula obstinata]|uniref:redoxin family protein n=1 Tax=Rubripirellula obstinata TaxID=406547 RepID=UPI000836E93C|nr:redoxin family protein [Rubripirellula obstinata]
MKDHLLSSLFVTRQKLRANVSRCIVLCCFSLLSTSLLSTSLFAAAPAASAALKLEPVQPDVDFERVPGDQAKFCKVSDIDRKGWSGWQVSGPDGAMLRRFADTNGDKKVDLWSYFKYGVEVYRDIDGDFDGKADQYRWLGTSGTRWGIDENEDGQIDRWKQISAEEVSSELVAALRESDPERFAALLITPSEVKSLGMGRAKMQQIAAKASRAATDFASLAKQQKAVARDARWMQFAATKPGVVPAGTDGSTDDVTVYENAVAMYVNGGEDGENGQLMVGTLVKAGDAWRLVDLPSLGTDGEAIAMSRGNFFTSGSARPEASAAGGLGQETQRLVTELEDIDTALASATKEREIASLHGRRSDIIESLIEQSGSPADRETWVRQLVDTLSVAVQSGAYPDGVKRLRTVSRKQAGDDKSLQAYADFEAISAEYVVRQTPKADFAEVQEWYLDALTGFVDRYPRTPEAARAWLQLALSKEFEDKEKEALGFYKKVAASFPGTDAGQRAAGAVKRLESVGQRIELEGDTLDGRSFKLTAMRGRPVVIHYWATWCEPCKQDMKLLRRLQANYKRAGLQVVGVNVDASADMAVAYLKETPLPWVQLFEPGGLEQSRLATSLGVQTLPTMMLIDANGKVVRHNIRAAELDEELSDMLKSAKR